MNDRPNALELMTAVRHYLETELIPALTDSRLRFQTLIAANVLGIVERELHSQRKHWLEEGSELFFLLRGRQSYWAQYTEEMQQEIRQGNVLLCNAIRHGEFDSADRFRALGQALRRIVHRKLEVANPRYLAGASATHQALPPQPKAGGSGTFMALPPQILGG
jgi:hypothetical protein